MSAKSQLLSTPAEATEVRLFPAGDYVCQIVEADVLSGFWKATENRPQARWFQSYVPTIRVMDYLRSGNAEQDEEQEAKLQKFSDDWQSFLPGNKGRFVQMQEIPGFEKKVLCAGIANGLNFILADTTPEWEDFKEYASSGTRFYTASNTHGEQDGFAVRTLSSDPEHHVPLEIPADSTLGDVVIATKGAFLVVSLHHVEDPTGQYETKVEVEGTSPV